MPHVLIVGTVLAGAWCDVWHTQPSYLAAGPVASYLAPHRVAAEPVTSSSPPSRSASRAWSQLILDSGRPVRHVPGPAVCWGVSRPVKPSEMASDLRRPSDGLGVVCRFEVSDGRKP